MWDQVLENGLKLGHGPQQRFSTHLVCTRVEVEVEEHTAYLGLIVRDRLRWERALAFEGTGYILGEILS
jgi:hypothetical protein